MRKLTILLLLLLISCSQKKQEIDIKKYSHSFAKDTFQIKGTYNWSFQLMGTEQMSIHSFYQDSILYQMKGKVYSTKYPMYKLSYSKKQNKWIGIDQNNVAYALFFKDETDSTLIIYKHKCKTNGLEEAINFKFPNPDATEDHGWNMYSKKGFYSEDKLYVLGNFSDEKNKISITENNIVLNGIYVEKMSFHSGERRWVGKNQNEYIQLFFKSLKNNDTIEVSIQSSNSLKELYQTKHLSITNWKTYTRKK